MPDKPMITLKTVRLFSLIIVGIVLAFIAVKTDGFKYFTSQEWMTTGIFCLIFYAIPQVIYISIQKLKDL